MIGGHCIQLGAAIAALLLWDLPRGVAHVRGAHARDRDAA